MMRDQEVELSKITKFKVKMQEAREIQLARLFILWKGGLPFMQDKSEETKL